MNISDSYFSGLEANTTSPVIYFANGVDYLYETNLLIVSNSTFINNKAMTDAGVIYSKNTNVKVVESHFENNRAITGDGGVFYFDCSIEAVFDC